VTKEGEYDPKDAVPTAASAGTDAGTKKLPDPDAPVAAAAREEREADESTKKDSAAEAPKGSDQK
jgi:hypothetical protein